MSQLGRYYWNSTFVAKNAAKTLYGAKDSLPTPNKELADPKCHSAEIENFDPDILYIFLTQLKMSYILFGIRTMLEKSAFCLNT